MGTAVISLDRRCSGAFRGTESPEKEDQKVRKVAVDDALFERLRELRMDMAQEAGVPPYVVFPIVHS